MKDESSDSIVERLSWLDVDSFRRGSPWLVGKEEFSKKLSKIPLPSAGVVCANKPPAAMLSFRADFIVGVLPSGSPRGIPRRVVMSWDSSKSERDGARNTRI